MRHVNIPVFIPHLGCPNDCVFCNQRKISGKSEFDITAVDAEIARAVSTIDYSSSEVEIAFFGGSFTGIDRGDMLYLLGVAKKYVDLGKAQAIRLSTRPDYIDGEILDILAAYSVTDIELGLQSMDDGVLLASRRGHTAEAARRACKMIKERGFRLIGQMMIGLPKSSSELEAATAEEIVSLGCDGARIYPTVVFCETELCTMMERGEYTPLTLDEAVTRSARVLEVFVKADIPVIRLGLCASDNLFEDGTMRGGAYHSAMGEMVYSELYYKRICEDIDAYTEKTGDVLLIYVPVGEISKASGQKKINKEKLTKKYGFSEVRIKEDAALEKYSVRTEIIGKGERIQCT